MDQRETERNQKDEDQFEEQRNSPAASGGTHTTCGLWEWTREPGSKRQHGERMPWAWRLMDNGGGKGRELEMFQCLEKWKNKGIQEGTPIQRENEGTIFDTQILKW